MAKYSIPTCDCEEALEMALTIQELAEQVPERGEEFASSVSEKAVSIAESIEEMHHCTQKQWDALENMLAGVQAWVD